MGSTQKGGSTGESKNTKSIWVMSPSKERGHRGKGHPSSVDSSCHLEQRDMLNHVLWEDRSRGRKAEEAEALAGSHSRGEGARCREVSKKEQWQSLPQDGDPETRVAKIYHVRTPWLWPSPSP